LAKDCGCDAPALEGKKNFVSPREIPSLESQNEAGNLPLLDVYGNMHSFRSVYEGDGSFDTHLVIFIRHFFCGVG